MKNRFVLWGAFAAFLSILSPHPSWAQSDDGDPVGEEEIDADEDGDAGDAGSQDPELANAAATATIEQFNAAIVEAIQAEAAIGFAGRLEIISPAVWEAFDMELLARRTIGRLQWRRWSDEQKSQYVDTLQLLQAATLADRFKSGSEVAFAVDEVTDGPRGSKLVHTRIVRADDEDVKLNYLLLERDDKWRVVDVYLNSTISEVATRRADYSGILRDEGYDALLAALNTQIDDIFERNEAVRSVPEAAAGD